MSLKSNGAAILIAPLAQQKRAPHFETPLPEALLDPFPSQRRWLWDLHANLHCSIVGTCFSTGELRQVLRRIGECPGVEKRSDHDLHSQAVALAGKHNAGAKLLHKALDRKFKSAIAKFDTAMSVESLQVYWREFLERGDIPGAYWAVLTHPIADEQLVQGVFGEVHMLSHLVGAANRADIRRLKQMEEKNSALQEKIAREETQLRDAVVRRDRIIDELRNRLGEAIAKNQASVQACPKIASEAKDGIAANLGDRLKREQALRERVEERLLSALSELSAEKKLRLNAEHHIAELRREVEIIEKSWIGDSEDAARPERLEAKTLLYVGGRSHHVCNLRRLAEERGAKFLHHDGGMEESSDLLPSLISRADAIFFPVDCVSHGAVAIIKRACRHMGKAYIPLRSSGLTSFVAALSEAVAPAQKEERT